MSFAEEYFNGEDMFPAFSDGRTQVGEFYSMGRRLATKCARPNSLEAVAVDRYLENVNNCIEQLFFLRDQCAHDRDFWDSVHDYVDAFRSCRDLHAIASKSLCGSELFGRSSRLQKVVHAFDTFLEDGFLDLQGILHC